MAKSKTPQKELSNDELREFADLLMLLLEEYGSDMSRIDMELDRLLESPPLKTISGASSYNRYIADIALYLRATNISLIKEYPEDKIQKYQTKIGKKQKLLEESAPEGALSKGPLIQRYWIRDFMKDLKTCFVTSTERINDRLQIKSAKNVSRTFKLYFWHWFEHDAKLQGTVVTGTLSIYNEWMGAHFEFRQPEGSDGHEGRLISYEGSVKLRQEITINNQNQTRITRRTYYLPLTEQNVPADQSSELLLMLSVRHNHSDKTVLAGTFTGADPNRGHPIMGRIFLIADSMPQYDTPEMAPQLAHLEAFARTYVTYQTNTIQFSSFPSVDDIPNFRLWQNQQEVLNKPLHGYFFKAIQENKNGQVEYGLVHFKLMVHTSAASNQLYQAVIEYDSPETPANKGFISIEQRRDSEAPDNIVFRGEFDFMPDQQRFRFQILFTKATVGDWYFGSIMGLNRKRQQLLAGRFAMRQEPLSVQWLDAKKLGELIQSERQLGDFLLEINQQIPTETLPLYNQLGWPHLPRPNQAFNELKFDTKLAGEYGCYALVRERPKGSNQLPNNLSADQAQLEDQYQIACYPLKIYPDGRLEMKFSPGIGSDNIPIQVKYFGRAFQQTDAGRLFLYFDIREEGDERRALHLSMYFKIQPNSQISRAFGISNRFVPTEYAPEARMEVLVSLKNVRYELAEYKTYDPLSDTSIKELNLESDGLGKYLSGRANRLILPFSNLQPNDWKPIPGRQDRFRKLHIRAALYEIEHGQNDPTECLRLLQEARRHGFGLDSNDIDYLTKELKNNYLRSALGRWEKTQQTKIISELKRLWNIILPAPIDDLFSSGLSNPNNN